MNDMKRNTVQRQVVLDTLREFKKTRIHPTVEEIYAEVHKGHPSISKTTVYRNLRELANDDLIRRVSFRDGLERYDGNQMPHYHFNCKDCSSILDVEIELLTDINDSVQEKYGYQVDDHDLVFSGFCLSCM